MGGSKVRGEAIGTGAEREKEERGKGGKGERGKEGKKERGKEGKRKRGKEGKRERGKEKEKEGRRHGGSSRARKW
jgi:hypothetical protein